MDLIFQYQTGTPVQRDDPGATLERAALRAEPVRFVFVAVVPEEGVPAHQQHRPALATHHHFQVQRKLRLHVQVLVRVVQAVLELRDAAPTWG